MCRGCTKEWSEKQEKLMRELMGDPKHRLWHESFHRIEQVFRSSATRRTEASLYCKFKEREDLLSIVPRDIKIQGASSICDPNTKYVN